MNLRSNRKVSQSLRRALFVLGAVVAASSATAQTATFNLANDTDFSVTLRGVNAGDLPSEDTATQAFIIDILTVGGVSDPFSTIGFCTEYEEFAVEGSNTNYSFDSLEGISSGRAGEVGTASTGIAIGGIGALRAGRVRYLFDQHYQGTAIDDWTRTDGTPDTLAFQIALWEITHDSDLDLDPTAGFFWIDPINNTGARRTNTLALAQDWLDELDTMATDASYESATWEVHALEQIGTPGDQDILYASRIPEPGATGLSLFAAVLFFVRRRR